MSAFTGKRARTPVLFGLLGAVAGAVLVAALLATGVLGMRSATVTRTVTLGPASATGGARIASVRQIYHRAQGSVAYVQVRAVEQVQTPFGPSRQQATQTGSGFVLTGDGYLVTNEHVIHGASDVRVRIGDGPSVQARVAGADASTDIALLKADTAETGKLSPLPLGRSSGVHVGDAAIAIGSPFGLQESVSTGIVSALDRELESPNGSIISGALQTDAAINPGSSGGPLLDARGRVVGVNAQIATTSGANSGIGFAVPIDTVKQVLARLQPDLRL